MRRCGVAVAVVFLALNQAGAQQVSPVYSFGAPPDGEYPSSALVTGADGALYGTTSEGGAGQGGTVFRLVPSKDLVGWSEQILHGFAYNDGFGPASALLLDGNGDIFGATVGGGGPADAGVVYELLPPSGGQGAWSEQVIHVFAGPDGAWPQGGFLVDPQGDLFSTTLTGGDDASGTVFELVPPGQGSTAWTHQILYSFQGDTDGSAPSGTLTRDTQGRLFGALGLQGPNGGGAVFMLSPPAKAGDPWAEKTLFAFGEKAAGSNPQGLAMDAAGALYGTAGGGPPSARCHHGCGIVFRLSPPKTGRGKWTEEILYSFDRTHGSDPVAGVVPARGGALYGTTKLGGKRDNGVMFKLVPPVGGGLPWTATDADLPNSELVGKTPSTLPTLARGTRLYGTASFGGSQDFGTIVSVRLP